MLKMILGVAVVFTVVYSIYCFFATIAQKSAEEQLTFYETFIKHLQVLAGCFIVTVCILLFIVQNF